MVASRSEEHTNDVRKNVTGRICSASIAASGTEDDGVGPCSCNPTALFSFISSTDPGMTVGWLGMDTPLIGPVPGPTALALIAVGVTAWSLRRRCPTHDI
jgi:hypothetical protein